MLYIISTPIGNLEDTTLRSLRLLKEAAIILCEDSRETRKLMNLLQIENKPKFVDLTRNHEFNWQGIEKVFAELNKEQYLKNKRIEKSKTRAITPTENPEQELKVILVSDSGTPGISDPGREVVEMAIEKNIEFTVAPGPSAVIPAAVASGFVKKEFEFLGFLPIKKGRQTAWKEIKNKEVPVVIYESSHRIQKFLEELVLFLDSEREICVYNDISKLHEKIWRFKVKNTAEQVVPEKGEFVVVINKFKKAE